MDYVTKEDLREALAPFATRDEIRADVRTALTPYPTREEVRAEIRTALAPFPTREEMRHEIRAALAPYPTREEMRDEIRAALVPYPTREEMYAALVTTRDEMFQLIREEGDRTRRHFDVVAESLRDDIRLLAEGQVGLHRRIDDFRIELRADIAALDRRVMRLEATRQ